MSPALSLFSYVKMGKSSLQSSWEYNSEMIQLKHPAEYSIQWVINKKELIISDMRVRYFLVPLFHYYNP